MVICSICNKEFKSLHSLSTHLSRSHKDISIKEYYDKHLKKENAEKCKTCGKETYFQTLVVGYRVYCSKTCSANNEKTLKKRRETCKRKYGVDSFSKTKEFEEKIKQTNLERFGVENPSQNKKIQEKRKQTF